MVHFKIFVEVLTLILGSGVAVALFRMRDPRLSRATLDLGLFVIFHNLLVLTDLGYRYWLVNIIDNDITKFSSVMIAGLMLIRIGADTGYTWFLFSAVRRIGNKRPNPVLLGLLVATGLLVFGLCVSGIGKFRRTGSIEWLVSVLQVWILAVISLVFLIILLALLSVRTVNPTEIRRSLRNLTLSLLVAYCLILLDELSFYRLGIEGMDLGNLPVLAVNLAILLWIWLWSPVTWRAGPAVSEISLDDLVEPFGISPREREVIEQLFAGKSNKEIQEALFISPSTVKNHLTSIYRKIGVDSRARLITVLRSHTEKRPAS